MLGKFESILPNPFKVNQYVKLFDPDDSKFPALVLDAAISINYQREADVTEYPVESGAVISDNINIKPLTISIEGVISNHPFGDMKSMLVGNATGIVGGALTSAAGGVVGTIATKAVSMIGSELLSTSKDKVRDSYQKLLEYMLKKKPLTLQTKLDCYNNMVITSISIPRDATTGEALRFSMNLKQITYVIAKTAKYNPKKKVNASKRSNLGKQQPQSPSEETKRKGSTFYKIYKWIKS